MASITALRHEATLAGGQGDAVGQFNLPFHIDIDEHGNIFVADFMNHRVQAVNSLGTPVCNIGSKGDEDAMFTKPCGVAVDRRRSLLYVADMYNNRVQVFAITYVGTQPSLRFVGKFGSEGSAPGALLYPNDIAVSGRSGNLYVAEGLNFQGAGNARIQVLTAEGAHVCFIGTGLLNSPYGVALDEDDTCYVPDHETHEVVVFGADGSLKGRIGSKGEEEGHFTHPCSICIDGERGLIIVGDNKGIQAFRKNDHSFVHKLSDKTFATPGVCVDSQGRIVAANCEGSSIERWA